MNMVWLNVVQLGLVGLLAGEEFIVRYGVQPALRRLPDPAHVAARIALVKRLKVVVSSLMLAALIASVALTVTAGGTTGVAWRIAGSAAFLVFLCFSLFGTVPINITVNDWDPEHPPHDWARVAHRWETIDTYRSAAAIASFILFAISLALQAR